MIKFIGRHFQGYNKAEPLSIVLDMLKREGLLYGLAKPIAVLDVTSIVANSGVEDVV